MKYFRVHTSDIAWITQKPRGIFTTVGKLVEAKTMTEEEIAASRKNLTEGLIKVAKALDRL